jgi:hypothetical protein
VIQLSLSNANIGEKAIKLVLDYLSSKGEDPRKGKKGEGADIVSGNKYIDVKGCEGKGTNIRMVQQALDSIAEQGAYKEGSFFIYYVYDMKSEPKLMIFDCPTFKKIRLQK